MLLSCRDIHRHVETANSVETVSLPSSRPTPGFFPITVVSSIARYSLLTSAIMLATTTTHASEYKLFNDRLEVGFLALQGFQSIQADDGAFRPEDEDQESNFQRLRVNLQLKFHITDNIVADVDIAEEPNDFGNNGDRDFSFHQDFGGIEFNVLGLANRATDDKNLTLRVGNIGAAPFQFKGFQDGADNQGNALVGNSPVDYATAENLSLIHI